MACKPQFWVNQPHHLHPKAWKLNFSQLHLPGAWGGFSQTKTRRLVCKMQDSTRNLYEYSDILLKKFAGNHLGSLFRKLGENWVRRVFQNGPNICVYIYIYQKHVSISIFWISYCFIPKASHREIKFIPLPGEWNLHDLWISGRRLLWEDSDERHRHNPKITIRRSETYTFTLRKKYSSLTIVFLKNYPKTPSVEGSPTPNFSLETPNFCIFPTPRNSKNPETVGSLTNH